MRKKNCWRERASELSESHSREGLGNEFFLDYLKVIILNGGKHNKKKPFNVEGNNNIKNNDKNEIGCWRLKFELFYKFANLTIN